MMDEEENDPATSTVNKIEDHGVEESSNNAIDKADLDQGEDSSLHVSNLTRNVTKEHLEEIFGHYGQVRSVELNNGKDGILKFVSAIVTFQKDRDAEQAMIHMDGGQIDGNLIKVSFVLVPSTKRAKNDDDVRKDKRHLLTKDEQHRDEKSVRNQRTGEAIASSNGRRDSEGQAKGGRSSQLSDRDRDRGDRKDVDRGRAVKSSEQVSRERGLPRGAPAQTAPRSTPSAAPRGPAGREREREPIRDRDRDGGGGGIYGPASREGPRGGRDAPPRRGSAPAGLSHYGPPPGQQPQDSFRGGRAAERGRDRSRDRDTRDRRAGSRDRDTADRRASSRERDRDFRGRGAPAPPAKRPAARADSRDRGRDRDKLRDSRDRGRVREVEIKRRRVESPVRDKGRRGRDRSSSASSYSSRSSSSSRSRSSKSRSNSSKSSSSSKSSKASSASKHKSVASSRKSRSRSPSVVREESAVVEGSGASGSDKKEENAREEEEEVVAMAATEETV